LHLVWRVGTIVYYVGGSAKGVGSRLHRRLAGVSAEFMTSRSSGQNVIG
jgi:hypothetical protein